MDARHRAYRSEDSDARITDILDGSASFEDAQDIPGSASLTYQNGFYVECTAIFIDIRGSSKLGEKYAQRRTLGRLYRAYVSECVAVLNASPRCSQVFIQGDCVSAVFDTPNRQAVGEVFVLVASLNSVVKLLNYRLARRGHATIKVGIGIDTGRALMLKAGFSGSGINDIVWMGDVVNRASHLCHAANKDGRKVIQVSKAVVDRLDQQALAVDRKTFVEKYWGVLAPDGWECDVVNAGMQGYLDEVIRQQAAVDRLLAPPDWMSEFLADVFGPPHPPPPPPPAQSVDLAAELLQLVQRQK
jgi:class 3 adenylate cyclase